MKGKYLRKKKRNSLMTVLTIALSVVLLILLAGGIYLAVLMDQVNYTPDGEEETLSSSQIDELLNRDPGETADPSTPTIKGEDIPLVTDPVEEIVTMDRMTFLLIGQDRRPGEPRARSDVMMLCTIDPATKTVTLTSLMRDMYVTIPGYLSNRINVPYMLGGMDLLKKTVKHNFGIAVDGCIEVDFNGFMDIVELVGGVDMELTKAEADHLNKNESFYGFPGESWSLQEGMNHLDAKQALSYSRIRRVGNSDFGRTERQRKVITAMLSQVKTLNVSQLNSLLMTGAGLVTTDMNRTELLSTAMSMIPLLSDLKINTLQIPAAGTYYDANIEGVGLVLVADMEKNRNLLAELYQ